MATRGRGRGVVQLRQPTAAADVDVLRKPGRPSAYEQQAGASSTPEEKPLPPSLNSILKSAVGEILGSEQNALKAAAAFNNAVTSVEDVGNLSERIISMCDEERASALALLCNGLSKCWQEPARVSANPKMAQFRNHLMKSFGLQFDKRVEFKAKSPQAFVGFVSFLSYLYSKMQLGEAPPSFLAHPIVECLMDLLSTQAEAECFMGLVEEIGQLMDFHNKPAMDKLCSFCREQLLREPCPLWKRCALLLVVELRASNWKLVPEVRSQYDSFSEKFRS